MRFKLLAFVVSLAVSVAAAEWVLLRQRVAIQESDRQEPGMIRYDRTLGWRLTAGWSGTHRHHDFETEYHVNQSAYRSEPAPSGSSRRIVLLGDSFTFGLGVRDDETFSYRLEQILAASGSSVDVLNLGVPGYSTDQELLYLRERLPELDCDVVVMVVYLGNDLFDNELDFPLQGDRAKPRFELDQEGLRLVSETVPRTSKPAAARGRSLAGVVLGDGAGVSPVEAWLGRSEILRRLGWLQPRYASSDDGFRQRFGPTLALFRALASEAAAEASRQGAELRVALLPGRSFIADPESVSARYQSYLRERILTEAGEIPVHDLGEGLRTRGAEREGGWYFPNEGHLTPAGHRVVAELLAEVVAR